MAYSSFRIGVNDVIFSKNTARIEIIITISAAIRTQEKKNFGHCICTIFHTYNCYKLNQVQTLYAPECTQTIVPHSYISVSKLWVNELGHSMPNQT